VIYTDRFATGDVKYRHLAGGAWGGEHVISSGPTDWTWSSLALVDDLDLHATWHQTVGDRGAVFYAIGDATAGTWESPRQVSTDGTLDNWQAAVAVDPHGITHVAWMKIQPDTEEGQILYRAVQFNDLSP